MSEVKNGCPPLLFPHTGDKKAESNECLNDEAHGSHKDQNIWDGENG